MSNQDKLIKRLSSFYREVGGEVSPIPPAWVPEKRGTARWLQPVLASVLVLALALGLGLTIRLVREEARRHNTPISAATPSPSPSASATATASPSATAVPAGWHGYVSPRWLYSLGYPATWYDLPNYGDPSDVAHKSFSNQNVGAPLEMESGGVWFGISVKSPPGSSCGTSSGANVDAVPITIDGEAATKYLTKAPNYQSSMWASVTHLSWCYEFTFITYSQTTRDQNMSDMNAIVASFRFNR
jgi:hypothetical protein